MKKDYSVGAFKVFLENIGELSDVNISTARNLRSTASLLLNSYVDGDIVDDSTDTRQFDVDSMIKDHFRNAETPPTSSTVQVYKSRYQSAIDKFIDYVKGDNAVSDEENPTTRTFRTRRQLHGKAVTVLNSEVRGDIETIDVPIPLRPGMILTLPGIPTDLTNEEAERIASILKVYARPQ